MTNAEEEMMEAVNAVECCFVVSTQFIESTKERIGELNAQRQCKTSSHVRGLPAQLEPGAWGAAG